MKTRPVKSSSRLKSRAAESDLDTQKYRKLNRGFIPSDWTLARIRQHQAELYIRYLGIAHHLYTLTADLANREATKLDNELCEAGLTGEMGMEVKNPDWVPVPSLPRELLEDIIRATQFLIDQGEEFKRYHEGQCRKCGKKLLRGKRLFCSRTCSNNWHSVRHRNRQAGKKLGEKYRVSVIADQAPPKTTDVYFHSQKEQSRRHALKQEPPKESCISQDKSLAYRKIKSSFKP